MSIIVFGASDDLIEIDGDISEEFQYLNNYDGDLLAFSDGTLLRIAYTRGIWRITPVLYGTAELVILQCAENDDENYSDTAYLEGVVNWVVHGVEYRT